MLSEDKLKEIEKTQSMSLADMKDVAPTIRKLQTEIDRLNRIMPHNDETCKHIVKGVHLGDWSTCSIDEGHICDEGRGCTNDKWELKE